MMFSDLLLLAALLPARILAAMRLRINSGRARNRPLDPRGVDFGAKRQVAGIVGAERVAVHDQHLAAVEVEHLLFRQQLHAAFAGEALADQEITVAVNEVAGDAAFHQRFDGAGDFPVQRVGIVVANPGFKQIAQDVQRIGAFRFTALKTQKTGGDRRFFCLQMQIRNKECRHAITR